jgi:hypothetical protein
MGRLEAYSYLPIDWDMTPEDAVALYLEWGNNWRKDGRFPVRSKSDVSYYFVVDTWGERPVVSLLRRNSEEVLELASLPLPRDLAKRFCQGLGAHRGVYGVTPEVRQWLERELDSETAEA